LVGGLFQGLRKDRGIKKPFHEDSSSGFSVEELRRDERGAVQAGLEQTVE
jgi:hypothetical protein